MLNQEVQIQFKTFFITSSYSLHYSIYSWKMCLSRLFSYSQFAQAFLAKQRKKLAQLRKVWASCLAKLRHHENWKHCFIKKIAVNSNMKIIFGVTSPQLKTGSLPLVTSRHLSGDPPASPSGVMSFMDGPLVKVLWQIKTGDRTDRQTYLLVGIVI